MLQRLLFLPYQEWLDQKHQLKQMKNELKQLEANILMYCFQSKQIDSILEEQVVMKMSAYWIDPWSINGKSKILKINLKRNNKAY